jgi:single-stranded-DNA-specific exonuclease
MAGSMQTAPSRWTCEPYEVSAAVRLCDELELSPTLATVLVRRGLSDPAAARGFLEGADRHDPLAMPGMPEARETILRHVERGSAIVVYGDYDVDGVCSTAMLVRTLRALGARPSWELPSRFGEGYGLSRSAVERLAAQGCELLLTVDCAVTAVEEVAAAREAGMDVVVTDHHRPAERLPDCPVVHPALSAGGTTHPGLGGYGCPNLCASGVVLKLSEALFAGAGADPARAEEDLDLAALATVCDLVPLRGENRRIAREGIERLRGTAKPGLRALLAVAGCEPADVNERTLGFGLGPRLNAAGRMQRADAALELLLTEDEARAEDVARELDLLNRDRREAEMRMLFEAEARAAPQASSAAIVVEGEDWHPGVVGIVASRLVERYHRPCVAIAIDGDAGRGSGRSTSAYDLHAGLGACAGHLRRFGGHRVAAGIEIERGEVAGFRSALSRHAGEALTPADLVPVERVDAVVPGGALGMPLADELERLRPFGAGNPCPTLLVPAARLEAVAGMGKERQHARFVVATGASRSRGVAFGSAPRSLARDGDGPLDLALRLERNVWNGTVEPRVLLRAVCPTRVGRVRELGRSESFWDDVERVLETDPGGWWPDAEAAAAPLPARAVRDRRGEKGCAGAAGDLLSSGESVLIAVADVDRRRAALEERLAGLAPGGLAVATWDAITADPAIAVSFDHLVALDPPPFAPAALAREDVYEGPVVHLTWGDAEREFALAVWRAELDLRPRLAELFRALREAGGAGGSALAALLRGGGRYPRSGVSSGRLLRVLSELGLAEYTPTSAGGPACRALEAARTDLEQSPAYRACTERLAALERVLEAPPRAPAPAGAAVPA